LKTRFSLLLLLAGLWTLANAVKPLAIDDTAYYYFARQIAAHPLDPYGFEILWYQAPEPANSVLAPPVLPYWWALGLSLFGDRPFLWKLWLFPFALLFVTATHALLRRFVRKQALLFTWMAVLSPVFLPSFNLMLDVPAQALGLGALVLFFRAADRRSPPEALLAGLVAGLAMQTKYTAFMAPAVMLLYSCFFGGFRLALLASGTAALIFVGWEYGMICRYGQSHFLYQFGGRGDDPVGNDDALLSPNAVAMILTRLWRLWNKKHLFFSLFSLLGGVCSTGTLLALTALGVRRRFVWLGMIVGVLGYLAIGVLAGRYQIILPASLIDFAGRDRLRFGPAHIIFFLFGLATVLSFLAVALRLCRRGPLPRPGRPKRIEVFLVAWLLLEVIGFFPLTPFPAARRVMGIAFVGTLLLCRLAARTCRTPERRRLLCAAAAYGILLATGFCAMDVRDAFAQKQAAERASQAIGQTVAGSRVWYVGHWGFQFYAERAGMMPVIPDTSDLHAGDWLVVPDARIDQQRIVVSTEALSRYRDLVIDDVLPWRTMVAFYGGDVPLEHCTPPRLRVTIYLVDRDFVPQLLIGQLRSESE
jgi:hypothetical protein